MLQVFLYRKSGFYLPELKSPGIKQETAAFEEGGKGMQKALFGLTKQGVLLFFSVFLDFYVFSSAKYAVDLHLGNVEDGIFNIIFMPASVIYLAANFLIKPYMTRLSEMLTNGDLPAFRKTSRGLEAAVLGLTALAVLASLVLGRTALTVIDLLTGCRYGESIRCMAGVMTVIVLGGGFYALSNLWYYILVMQRRQKVIFLTYCTGAVLAALLSGPAAKFYGMAGGACCLYRAPRPCKT